MGDLVRGTGASLHEITDAVALLQQAVGFDVKSFGAIGDGAADDTAAIQAAINACPPGGALYFPPTTNGAAYLTGKLTISQSYITLVGARGTLLRLKNGTNDSLLVTPNDGVQRNGLRIKGLALDGNAANQTGSAPLIDIYGMDDFFAEDLYIANPRGAGIRIGAAGATTNLNPYIVNCLLRGDQTNSQGAGIELDSSSSDCHITGCDIGYFKNGPGILLSGHNGGLIADTDLWQNKHGLQFFGANRTRVSNTLADLSSIYGFFVQQSSDLQFDNCQARESSQSSSSTYEGFHFEGSSGTPAQDIGLSNCRAMGAIQKYGIVLLQYVNNLTLVGGSMRGNVTAAAVLTGTGVSAIRSVGVQGITDQ